jgi:hypothetical protein
MGYSFPNMNSSLRIIAPVLQGWKYGPHWGRTGIQNQAVHQLWTKHESDANKGLTSAAFSILPTFLTTGSKASKLELA